jgi:sialidase-1
MRGQSISVMTIALLLAAGTPVVTEAALVAHYTFDEGVGATAFDSAGNNDGVIYGAQRVGGVFGGALDFDGADDYVALPDNSPVWLPEHDFTCSVWVCFDTGADVSGQGVLLDLNCTASADPANDNGCVLLRKDNGQTFFGLNTTTTVDEKLYCDPIYTEGRWHHIAALRDGSTQALYVDGNPVGSRTCSVSPIDFSGGSYDDDGVNIGTTTTNNNPTGIYFFDGKIDDVRIYNVALSDSEIKQLAIPEPATLWLLAFGVLPLLRKRTS